MTDPRDYRSNPRLTEPRNDLRGGFHANDVAASNARTGSSVWAWLAGIAAVMFIIAIVYGFTNRDAQTALDRNAPRATTGSATSGVSATGSGATTGAGGTGTTGAGSTSGGSAPNAPRQSGQ
jgi:hypothetical protein